MIVVLKQNSDKGHVEKLMQHFTDMGLRINYSEGADTTILGLMGDTTRLDERDIMAYDVVERVQRVTEPFKAVNRKFHPEDTIIEVAGRKIGTGYFNVMAGARSRTKHRSSSVPSASRLPVHPSCAAAHSSPVPPRTRSRVWRPRVSSCCSRQSVRPVCRSSPRS